MDTRKQTLLETLDTFVNQRPGLDPRDYGGGMDGWRCYRRESAAITRDRNDYYAIRGQVSWRDSITADDIIKASEHAFSGRLTITEHPVQNSGYYGVKSTYFKIDYCAGQYMPTEYRKAACAVLASSWWDATRQDCPIEYESGQSFENSPGGWMSKQALRTFGRGLQSKYFR